MFDQLLLFGSGKLHAQAIGNFFRDFVLDQIKIRKLVIKMSTPNMAVILRVHQLRADFDGIPAVEEPTGQDRTHMQGIGGGLHIRIRALETKDRAAGHDAQSRQA